MSSKFFECPFMLKLKTLVKQQNYDKSSMAALKTISRALDAPVQRGNGKLVWQLLVDEGVLRPVEGGWSSAAWLKENGFFYGEVPETVSEQSDNTEVDNTKENIAKLDHLLQLLESR
jgi:hypothetical protein